MKTTAFLLFGLAAVFSLALFYNIRFEKSVNHDNAREQMFSILIDDEVTRNEFLDALKAKYPEVILSSTFEMMNSNKRMQSEMMNLLVPMCYTDPEMNEMMVGMAMNMADLDPEKCCQLSEMMVNHVPTMKCVINTMYKKGILSPDTKNEAMKKISAFEQNKTETENSFQP